MAELKRNDKVYLLCPHRAYRKMSDEVQLHIGKLYIIKQVIQADEVADETWVRIYGPMTRGDSRSWGTMTSNDYVGVQLGILYKYTKIGELLYG